MKYIYAEALSVIAWLGPSDRHSSKFIRVVKDVTLTDDRPPRLRTIKRALQIKRTALRQHIMIYFDAHTGIEPGFSSRDILGEEN